MSTVAAPLFRTSLERHPTGTGPSLTSVCTEVRRDSRGLEVAFEFSGALEDLVFPRGRLDPAKLWEHTCVEVFIASRSGGYTEWNFSPTGQATRFEFSGYRCRSSASFEQPISISVEREETVARVLARGPLLRGVEDPIRLGLAAVVRAQDGACSYWALCHPKSEPDFHDDRSFLFDAAHLCGGPIN